MAATGSSKSAQERREAQREVLRKQRQSELKRQRTVRTVVIAAITVVALVIVAGAGYLIFRSMQPEGPVAVPEGMSADQPYLTSAPRRTPGNLWWRFTWTSCARTAGVREHQRRGHLDHGRG